MTEQQVFTPEQISHMLALQDELNSLIHPQWKEQGFDWSTAIIDECQELLGWLGWKWWKNNYQCGLTEQNKKQVQVEVIDILHFYLSKELVDFIKDTEDAIAGELTGGFNLIPQLEWDDGKALVETIKSLREYASQEHDWPLRWTEFGAVMFIVGLSPAQVYEIYLGKYTLNIFRQKHGYKDGTYKKHWLLPAISIEFQEDNWYLEKALADIKEAGHTVSIEEIDNRLEYWYGILEGGK